MRTLVHLNEIVVKYSLSKKKKVVKDGARLLMGVEYMTNHIIVDVQSSCNCVSVLFPIKTLTKLSFHTAFQGSKNKYINVYANEGIL